MDFTLNLAPRVDWDESQGGFGAFGFRAAIQQGPARERLTVTGWAQCIFGWRWYRVAEFHGNQWWLDINTMTQIYASTYLFLIEYEFDGYYYFISNSSFLHWEWLACKLHGLAFRFPTIIKHAAPGTASASAMALDLGLDLGMKEPSVPPESDGADGMWKPYWCLL